MSFRVIRRAALVAFSLVTVASVGSAQAAFAVPSVPGTSLSKPSPHYAKRGALAADWQASQLSRGRIHNAQFDFNDWGLTVDTGFMLAADGSHPAALASLKRAVRHHYGDYTGTNGAKYAGAVAKTLVFIRVVRANPRNSGGVNVRRQLIRLMADSGRFRDATPTSGSIDYSNVISQSYAVIGLARTGGVPQAAVKYLLKERCRSGYFRLKEAGDTTCGRRSTPDVDATALALQALVTARRHGAPIRARTISRTAGWLASAQHLNGAFGGGASTSAANTNSTGLAANALSATGHSRARLLAAGWVARRQITKQLAGNGPAKADIGAIAYRSAALRKALAAGIGRTQRDQFRRATPQAYFALAPAPLNSLLAPR
jgi:hypothetical protein